MAAAAVTRGQQPRARNVTARKKNVGEQETIRGEGAVAIGVGKASREIRIIGRLKTVCVYKFYFSRRQQQRIHNGSHWKTIYYYVYTFVAHAGAEAYTTNNVYKQQ